jgi:branched-chain amino acid transport system permease protein
MLKNNYKIIALSVFLALLLALPRILDSYVVHILVLSIIFAIFALAYDIVLGTMGQFSFGHHALWGLGAYISGLLALDVGVSVWLSIPIATIGTALMGLIIGLISLRLRGAYLGIITLGFAMITEVIAGRWDSITHGFYGVKGIPSPEFFGTIINQPSSYYYLVLTILLVVIFVISRMHSSRFGRGLDALRRNEKRAVSLGIPVFKYFVIAFTISAAISGLAGACYAHYVRTLTPPTTFSIWYLWVALVIVLIGGSGTIGGPLIGSLIFVFVPEFLRMAEEYRFAVFGAIVVAVVIFMPGGIYARLVSLWNRFIPKQNL